MTEQDAKVWIPQREPFVFVDTIADVNAASAVTRYVVKACERLYRKGYNIKLLLFDTHVSEKMQQKYRNFKCSCPYEFVLDHPFSRNSELFGRADCFVSAENPKYSGWNNTVAEAMACGLPVVSTKAGTADLLIDGVNGIRSARWVFCFEKHIARLYHDEQCTNFDLRDSIFNNSIGR